MDQQGGASIHRINDLFPLKPPFVFPIHYFPCEIINFGSLFKKANSTFEQQQHPNNTVLRLQSDLSKLKTKCNTYEKENFELRRLLGGDRTPKYLPISSPTHPHSSPSPSR